jgi:hypothetical protein
MWKKAGISGVALIVAFGLGEVAIRAVDPPLLWEDGRVILTSVGIVLDESGSVRYPPNRQVRSILLSDDGVDFDVRYATNDHGLIDHRDYGTNLGVSPSWAFVGDSFAAGVEGGEPWIPKLRDTYDLEIYNLGIGATGVLHFARILASKAETLAFDDIVIIAISDDFFRPLWTPLEVGDEIWICLDGEDPSTCRERRPIAYIIDPELSDSAVLAHGEAVSLRAGGARTPSKRVVQFLKNSRLLLFTKRLADAAGERRALRTAELVGNLAALETIRSDFPEANIRMIQVPDKHEARRGRYDFDASEEVRGRGIEYFDALNGCTWPPSFFHPRDRHLNAIGYDALAECVAEYLDLSIDG